MSLPRTLPHLATTLRFETQPDYQLLVASFTDVQNAGELKKDLLAGSIAAALLDSTWLADVFQLHAAAASALLALQRGSMRTRNIHTELIFHLSPNRNIKAALDSFGAAENTSQLLVAAFVHTPQSASTSAPEQTLSTVDEFSQLCARINGVASDVRTLNQRCNVDSIRKVRLYSPCRPYFCS
jgi:EKC/KEOPS complex subunit CGI121/TPRKB